MHALVWWFCLREIVRAARAAVLRASVAGIKLNTVHYVFGGLREDCGDYESSDSRRTPPRQAFFELFARVAVEGVARRLEGVLSRLPKTSRPCLPSSKTSTTKMTTASSALQRHAKLNG
ncbi:hypothetical protein DFH11DRAFT_1734315 [Phellopilus nigrolimitatus]|nr:hypothetical protein DFH11DRAFT_1734315 [Phellopilus nigrolimitatus]